jgi:hypothetical protein
MDTVAYSNLLVDELELDAPSFEPRVAEIPAHTAMANALRTQRNDDSVQELLKHPGIWRRSTAAPARVRAVSTGLSPLDALLPGGGWPLGALSEILFAHDGIGELSLTMPALAQLTQRKQRVVFVAPPYIPYAPALEACGLDLRYVVQIDAAAGKGAWSAEQCLRSGACGAVLGWFNEVEYTQLRRLQLAAESGDALAFLFRPARVAAKASPAALRLQLHADAEGTQVEILKCRGNLDAQGNTRLRCRIA